MSRKKISELSVAVLAITSIMSVFSIPNLYGQNTPEKIGGELSPKVAWRIENNTLYLCGTDTVPSTMYGTMSAWHNHRTLFQSVVIEDGITYLGLHLFMNFYKNINSLTIGENVRFLGPQAFGSCTNLSVVEVKSATPPDINYSTFYRVGKKTTLIVPAGTKSIYEADPIWNKFVKIEESSQPAVLQPAPAEILATPCIINLTRTAHYFGGAVKAKVFLNGEEVGKIGNKQSIVIKTNLSKNVLIIKHGTLIGTVRRFDATAGGEINIEFSAYF